MTGSIAVIGVGAMGAPMARRLQRSGFDVVACDRSDEALAAAARDGCRTTRQAADCAASDVVLVLVATVEQVRAVAEAVAQAIEPGSHPRMVVMSTVPADVITEVATLFSRVGASTVDAPVSGGAVRAANGELSVIAGGTIEDVEALRPVFDAIASQVFHCGPLGAGATMKIVNNIVGTASTMALAEACRLALESGLAIEDVPRVLEASTGRTYLTGSPGEIPEFFSTVARSRESFDSLAAIMRKDYGLAAQMAGELPGDYPLVDLLAAFARSMGEETYENWHASGVPTMTSGRDL